MISFLIGLLFIATGLYGIVRWFPDFAIVLRGLIPMSLVLGGLVAVVAGFGAITGRKRSNAKKAQ